MDKEFGNCLRDLKQYCLQLDTKSERKIDERSWNYIIQHFCKEESFHSYAIELFERVVNEKKLVNPNVFTLKAILKVCSEVNVKTEFCEQIVNELECRNSMNVFLYAQFIKNCILNDDLEIAFQKVLYMQRKNMEPNFAIFIPLIKAATIKKHFTIGIRLYELAKNSNLSSPQLSMTIISFAFKARKPELVLKEIELMESKGWMSIITWNCLVQAHIQMKNFKKALDIIREMKHAGVSPDSSTFNILITACADFNLLEEGKSIHKMAINELKEDSVELSTSIANFYNKCGYPEIAIQECEKIKSTGLANVVTWTCLIQAYTKMNQIKKAIDILKENNFTPDSTTFVILLTACANSHLFGEGKEVHQLALSVLKKPTLELNNTIVHFYTKCGHPEIAIQEFEKIKSTGLANVVTWTCLIQAYIQMRNIAQAIKALREMKHFGIEPNSATFSTVITACANSNLFEEGQSIHKMAINTFNEESIEFLTSVVNFYTKCGYPEIAIKECERIQSKGLMNVVSWNCLIQAHTKMNQIDKAIEVITDMKKLNLSPDSASFTILLGACADYNLFEEGKLIYGMAINTLNEESIEFLTSVVNFYTKCGYPEIAIKECERIQSKGLMNVISWNCLIQAHIKATGNIRNQSQKHIGLENAITVFKEMKQSMYVPDKITYLILLDGCGEYICKKIGLDLINEIKLIGMDVHEEIVSSMIYFYSRISYHSNAEELFQGFAKRSQTVPSVIIYNTMLACYAQHGHGLKAINLFNDILERNVEINEQTLTIMLNTFSHCGMVDRAFKLYGEMSSKFNCNPSVLLDSVMVDVFARAGNFDKAENLINNRTEYVLWAALMAGCRKFNNIPIGEKAFNILTSIDEKQASPYILLSHIYTYHGLYEKADYIQQLMLNRGIKKIPGIVYIEEEGKLYQFVSGVKKYERYDEIEEMREEIYQKIKRAGFQPDTRWVTNPKLLTEEEKLDSLCRHTEKTAIAFAFVLNPDRKAITLIQNLRVCNDCHNAIEYISKVMNVEIIVRDANRYHHFKDGKCSCDRYW